jgi:hypothetical protein
MPARIARRVGIDTKQRGEPHNETRLFVRLPHGRVLYRLAQLHETTRQRPAGRRVAAANEHDGAFGPIDELNDHIYAEQRGDRRHRGLRK